MNILQNNLYYSLKISNKQINQKLYYLNILKKYDYNLDYNLYIKLIENINNYKNLIDSISLVLDNINYIFTINFIFNFYYCKFNYSTINEID
jgi:hypothetical protein